MGRKRRGKAIHGWIIIDKPGGLSSSAVVGRVRRLTGAATVGHAGTLAPLATGVLPMALGEATKIVSYLMDGAKAYRFTVRWGEQRDTDDKRPGVNVSPNRLTMSNNCRSGQLRSGQPGSNGSRVKSGTGENVPSPCMPGSN